MTSLLATSYAGCSKTFLCLCLCALCLLQLSNRAANSCLKQSKHLHEGGHSVQCVHQKLDLMCWAQVAPMESVRGSLAAVALDNKLFAMGGGQPNVNRDTTEIYHAHRNQWVAGPTMTSRRFTTAAALHNNSIYVSGGYDGTQYLRSVERLDPREGKWQTVGHARPIHGCHLVLICLSAGRTAACLLEHASRQASQWHLCLVSQAAVIVDF